MENDNLLADGYSWSTPCISKTKKSLDHKRSKSYCLGCQICQYEECSYYVTSSSAQRNRFQYHGTKKGPKICSHCERTMISIPCGQVFKAIEHLSDVKRRVQYLGNKSKK